MDAQKPPLKILMFPWLAHGHVFPFLQLSVRLSQTKNYHIHFCSTSINLDYVKQALSRCESNKYLLMDFVQLELPILPQLPQHFHTTKNIPPHLMPTLMEAFQKSSPKFHHILLTVKPDLLIYDGFQPWAAKQAKALGIPPILFVTSGATAMSFYHHMYSYESLDSYPFPGIYLNGYQMKNVASQEELIKVDDVEEGFAFGMFKLSTEIVLIKSSREFEGKYLEYLSELSQRRIVPVGALVGDVNEGDAEIIQWLDGKDQSSTIYISFGSENYLSKDQVVEVAKGLELSNANFIWVIRSATGDEGAAVEEVLPRGFVDRTKQRGMVLQGWAPQMTILSHRSTGGFMSHCGWSSIMESMYWGVPVLGVPLKLDQPVNCRIVVESGVGVEVARDGDGKFYGEGVAKAIKEVIVGKTGEAIRGRAGGMSAKMRLEDKNEFSIVMQELSTLSRNP